MIKPNKLGQNSDGKFKLQIAKPFKKPWNGKNGCNERLF